MLAKTEGKCGTARQRPPDKPGWGLGFNCIHYFSLAQTSVLLWSCSDALKNLAFMLLDGARLWLSDGALACLAGGRLPGAGLASALPGSFTDSHL